MFRGKPIRYGFKVWGLCYADGSLLHVEPYCGSCTRLEKSGMGQGSDVVKGLVMKAEMAAGTKVFYDNLFTSVPLSLWLSGQGFGGTGTMRQNRLYAVPIPKKKEIETYYNRGESISIYSEDIVLSAWMDNKPVFVLSNCFPAEPFVTAKRWCRIEKKKVDLPMPATIEAYNQGMGGVDLLDQMVACYRPHIRKRKWWWCFHTWSLATTSVNAWRLLQAATNTKMDYLTFLRGLVSGLLLTFGQSRKRPGRSLSVKGGTGEQLRTDGLNHWIVNTERRLLCKLCYNR